MVWFQRRLVVSLKRTALNLATMDEARGKRSSLTSCMSESCQAIILRVTANQNRTLLYASNVPSHCHDGSAVTGS